MIAVSEPLEFIPRGRQAVEEHPGSLEKQQQTVLPTEHVLLQRMQNVNISATTDEHNEYWSIREIYEDCDKIEYVVPVTQMRVQKCAPHKNNEEQTITTASSGYMCECILNSEEELYVKKNIAVWSKGLPQDPNVLPSISFTCETPIKFAFFCNKEFVRSKRDWEKNDQANDVSSICLIDQNSLRVYCNDGEDFLTHLEFPVSNVWQTRFGILLEKVASNTVIQNHTISMPRLFSLAHPLDEICPVLNKTSTNVVNYFIESDYNIIYSSESTNLLLLFDTKIGKHFISRLRKANPEEIQLVNSQNETSLSGTLHQFSMNRGGSGTCMGSGSASSFAQSSMKFGGTSQKHSLTNLRRGSINNANYSAHISKFLNNAHSFTDGFAGLNRTGSPLNHLQSTIGQHSISVQDIRKIGQSQPSKPIVPELCLEHIWTENTFGSNREFCEKATSAFVHTDLVDQSYLCYLLPRSSKLQLVSLCRYGTNNIQIATMSQSVPAKDAVGLTRMRMIAVLDPSGTLILYTGTTMVSKVHITPAIMCRSQPNSKATTPNLPNSKSPRMNFPKRSSLLPSVQKPLDNAFDEELHLLSPVQPLQSSQPHRGNNICLNLRDAVGNRLSLVYSTGKILRTAIPLINETKLVTRCIMALKKTLKRNDFLLMITQWYCIRNRPGSRDFSIEQEWQTFSNVLLNLMGCAPCTTDTSLNTNSNSFNAEEPKKRRKNDEITEGTAEDWNYMMNILNSSKVHGIHKEKQKICENVDTTASLFTAMPAIFYSFHLLYEDFKLDESLHDFLPIMGTFLHQFAIDMQLSSYTFHYLLDLPQLVLKNKKAFQLTEQHGAQMQHKELLQVTAPSIYNQLESILKDQEVLPYKYIEGINDLSRNVLQVISLIMHGHKKMKNWIKPHEFTAEIQSNYIKRQKRVISLNSTRSEQLIEMLLNMQITRKCIERLPVAIHLIIAECLEYARLEPPIGCSSETYELILRSELAAHARLLSENSKNTKKTTLENSNCEPEDSLSARRPSSTKGISNADATLEDGMDNIDTKLLSLRFPDDMRIAEVRRLLRSSEPVVIDITQLPGTSDHEFIEEQEKQLFALCIRTMTLPMGRGMFTLRTSMPTPTESMPIPKLCLTGREPVKGATIEMQQIEFPANMSLWPSFHNGVASGLKISPNARDVDSTWIVYNKPKNQNDNSTEHAGFLMALGLNGHLKTLSFMSIYEYLVKCDEMTSVGLLLGISATHRGTMNNTTTKLLSVHIEALLPATALELDIPQNIQVASLMGIGLLYQGTAKRHIAEVLLQEVGRPPGPEMENCIERESYSLTAGLALGLVTLGQGESPAGLRDLQLPDTLHYYMVGGNKRPLSGAQKEKYKLPSFQVREGDNVNIDVTAPGATIALGLMFFNTNNSAVAEWMLPPSTRYQLDLVRPDLLLLRTIARGLIIWDHIEPNEKWLFKQFPANLQFDVERGASVQPNDNIDHEAITQAYCNIIAGSAFCIGLKYASTEHPEAMKALRSAIKLFLGFPGKYVGEFAGRTTIESSLMLILISLSLVFAGSGDLEVLRLIRYLRSRIGSTHPQVTYGSHMAVHMSLGLLFLGAGRFAIAKSPEAVAALVCAFFPKFPNHSNDNRYHLQAFRHLYVMAVEPRLFLPRDIDTRKLCLCNISVLEIGAKELRRLPMAPCILPELSTLEKVVVDDTNYWTVSFERGRNWDLLVQALKYSACIDIKKRSGCLSHLEDPDRLKSLFSQTLTTEQYLCWEIDPQSLERFSTEPQVIAFIDRFLLPFQDSGKDYSTNELGKSQQLTILYYNALIKDKMHVYPIYMSIFAQLTRLKRAPSITDVHQFKIIDLYLSFNHRENILFSKELVSSFIIQFQTSMEDHMQQLSLHLRRFLTSKTFEVMNIADLSAEALSQFFGIINCYNLTPNLLSYVDEFDGTPNYIKILMECKKLNLETNTIYCILKILRTTGLKM